MTRLLSLAAGRRENSSVKSRLNFIRGELKIIVNYWLVIKLCPYADGEHKFQMSGIQKFRFSRSKNELFPSL